MKKGLRKCIQTVVALSLMAQTALPGISSITFAKETTLFTVNDVRPERKLPFSEDWKFFLGNPQSVQDKAFDDAKWRNLDLPHDWSIEFDFDQNSPGKGEAGFLNGGIGWYRKTFTVRIEMEGKKVSIRFGGVYMDSSTYVNGILIGNYPNGYTPFTYDITDHIVADGVTENTIAVKVVNQQPTSRWYSGSGIYRNVDMIVTEAIHVKEYGTFVTTPNIEREYKNGAVTATIKTDIVNDSQVSGDIVVKSTVYDLNNQQVGETAVSDGINIEAGKTKGFEQDITVNNPKIWSLDSPSLYTLRTEVVLEDRIVDTYDTKFGMRWFNFDPNTGFSLNGENMKLHGVCMHHDQGALGAVANYRAIERQMEIMKDMGVNSIRVSHNPASDELLEICDRLGLLVIDEGFDTWEDGKISNDYSKYFSKAATHPNAVPGMTWAEYDLKQLVHRGKNSPSVIMWSIGNEINGMGHPAKNVQIAKKLVGWIKDVDTTRPTTIGENKVKRTSGADRDRVNEILSIVDIAGYNYDEQNYDAQHVQFPERIIYGSETSSSTRSRGIYAHPDTVGNHDAGVHPDYQQSSYGNEHVGWGKTASDSWKQDRDRGFVAGQFIWTGFDYIGEATPWHNIWPPKSSYFGIVDTAGFPKDDYYFYQSQWTNVEENPMVHILPHWNWEDKEIASKVTVDGKIPMRIYSNAKKVELFQDGKSLGVKEFVSKETNYGKAYQETSDGKLYLEWRVPYKAGKLEAVAMDKDNNILARDVVISAGTPAGVKLTADRDVIKADGHDLSYITVDIVDKEGNFVPTADNLVNFNITGNGEIVGVDNGNAVSHERYKDTDGIWMRKAFSGKALVIVKSTPNAGSFTLTATSPGLSADRTSVFTLAEDSDEKIILGYKIPTVMTTIGVAPELPKQITAVYSDHTTAMMDVTWDEIDSELLDKPQVVKINGIVIANGDEVKIGITVTGIIGIKDTKIVTGVGVVPTLPDIVEVIHSDGNLTKASVTWDKVISKEDVAQIGKFERSGKVEGLDQFTAKAFIRVTDEVEFGKNIAVFNSINTGYPKITASHEGGDKLANIINGSSVFGNRWTNWTAGGYARQEKEWVSLEFEKMYEIGKVGVYFYTDGATKAPTEMTIDVSENGIEWVAVKDQSQTNNFAVIQGDVSKRFDIEFNPILAKYIRFNLTGQPHETVGRFKPIGLTEIEVYTDIPSKGSSKAELETLKINNEMITEFSPTNYTYTKELGYTDPIPTITAVAKENGTVVIVPAFTKDSATTVSVTSEDGTTTKVYTVEFMASTPKLSSSKISLKSNTITEDEIVDITMINKLQDDSIIGNQSVDIKYDITSDNGAEIEIRNNKIYAFKKGTAKVKANVTYNGTTIASNVLEITIKSNTEEKTIVSYASVTVLTDKGVAPVLPQTVRATFDKGLPKDVAVEWETISEDRYEKYGELSIRGTVEGQALRPTAKIIIKGAVAVQNFSGSTPVGVVRELPEKANVYFSDGTLDQLAIVWEECNENDFRTEGTVTINGYVVGNKALKTQITIRVSADVAKGTNIAQLVDGFDMPAAMASFTNNGAAAKEKVEHLNDGVVSYTDNESFNRWSNWQRTPREKDWIGIAFGIGRPEKKYFNNMEVDFFKDKNATTPTGAPKLFKIQYYTGPLPEIPRERKNIEALGEDNPLNKESNWADVENLSPKVGPLAENDTTTFTFDMVKSYAVRIKMTKQDGFNGLAATEIRVFEDVTAVNNTFDVTSIELDGVSIENFNQETLSYNIELPQGQLPIVTATATNNAAVTIIPANDTNGVTKLIVTAENGVTTKTYQLRFTDTSIEEDYITFTVKEALESGKEFTAIVGIEGMEKPVYAQDITLKYNPELVAFDSLEAAGSNELISEGAGIKHNKELGIIRILGVFLDGKGLVDSGDLLKVNFIAKPTEQDRTGNISISVDVATVKDHISELTNLGEVEKFISIKGNGEPQEPEEVDKTELITGINQATHNVNNAVIGDKLGQYPQSAKDALLVAIEKAEKVSNSKQATQDNVNQALITLKQELDKFKASIIKETDKETDEADVNGDGKVDLKDMEYVVSYYQAKQGDAHWNGAKKADVTGDGKVDIQDIACIARRILGLK